ncbi:hypothetical protein SEUBUCD646_0N02790 [Saccharomyces eubayanus]|uniref:Threonyl/alanyl tRNA synthetase SAD domain-containing protein n=1 Tax=Saccharomyces eubayanus TaxID=1080349 RepID=A0ABN8VM40_SACEU|nr:hypothetical protein SEUBUCD650_0N02780 [Saccharomyces eubayanus]CAI1721374.1 hypothetical protein SEUBUCD646_0N02790 [Saccharomyces eubayanus]
MTKFMQSTRKKMETHGVTKTAMVGGLACQRNSFLFDGFKTVVVSCEPKKDKKGKAEGYDIELQDTILFPEGGGQPSDSGLLRIVKGNGDSSTINKSVQVPHISRSGLHAKHHVKEPIEPGTTVEIVVDAVKRMGYMQQHTGQHLLSAIIERKYQLKTISWSMGGLITEKKSTLEPNDYFNYIEINRKLTEGQITEISDEINQFITKSPQEITVVERISSGVDEVDTSKIPDDYDLSKGILRTIQIGVIDSNPCCGTHLESTSQIGSILILPNQTTVRGSNSKVYFMCGKRVADYANSANKTLSNSKSLLSCSESQVPEKIEMQGKKLQQSNKREQYWIKKLAHIASEELRSSLKASGKRRAYFMEEEFGTLELLLQIFKGISTHLNGEFEAYEIILCGYERQTNTGSLLILSESGEKISSLASKLGSMLQNLKGGGGKKGGKWQGKITSISNAELAALTDYLTHEFIAH